MSELVGSLRVDERFQGPTGRGQGGWAAARLAAIVAEPVTVWLRAAIPLAVEMGVRRTGAGWSCTHGSEVILEATPWDPDTVPCEPITIDEAVEGRHRFLFDASNHHAPQCFSCGMQPDSMRVHAGPLPDRGDETLFATDWTPPDWAVRTDGSVDPGVLWAALDCTSAFFVCCHPVMRRAFTGTYAVEVFRPVEPGETLALVSWAGDSGTEWKRRKRGAASAAFAADGDTVARARSLWIAVEG